MKIKLDIDCSPKELREFFGLPDLSPLHEKYMDYLELQLKNYYENFDAKGIFEKWLPQNLDSFNQFQKFFWPTSPTSKEE
jgi:Family of unknown function (DUF6489)